LRAGRYDGRGQDLGETMARLRHGGGQSAASEDSSLRIRASWLYYNHGLTQKEVSERLGISRGTAIRVLNEAVQRGEVQIWISEGEAECIELAVLLESTFRLDEAIVVPAADNAETAAKSVGLALGKFLSEAVTDNLTIGVGWGRTLMASLASLRPVRREGVKVVSLLGGVVEARGSNPLEYSWRMANQFGADCYLFIAPAFVDSVATKRRLIEKCGLDKLYTLARNLDIAVVSAGDINLHSTSLSAGVITREELCELVAMGCVCDVLCNFLDADGNSVPHPLNKRAMSVDLDDLRKSGHLIIATGGAQRAEALRAAIKRIGCNTLITDESAARALLAREGVGAGRPVAPRSA
jgi:DNA-binding transcriptional regulator LsrR (DeoR family)